MIDFDLLLDDLGPMTTREKIQLVFLLLPASLSAMHMAGMMFLGFNQRHFCSMPQQIIQECNVTSNEQLSPHYSPYNEETQSIDSCLMYKLDSINCTYWTSNSSIGYNRTERCDSWTYDTSVFTTTVVSEFGLVCDNKHKRRLSQAIFMLGVTIGTTLWGQISDRFGRRIAVVLPMVVGVVFGIATAYTRSFLEFTIIRFLVGICIFPSYSCAFVLATETAKKRHKVWIGQTFQAMFGVGICILPGMAYFVRHWRIFQLCISLPGVIIAILLWYIYESPRWLMSTGSYTKANQIVKTHLTNSNRNSREAKKLQAISDLHQADGTKKSDRVKLGLDEKVEIIIADKAPKQTVIEIWKLPNMRRKSIILCYEWMVTSMVYYGLTLNAAELGGNPFIDAFLSAITEIPSCYIAMPMLQKWGRRPTLISTLFLAGIACNCMMFVSKEMMWLNVSLSIIGKFSISATFGTVYIYTADIYPTPVRNVGLGVCSSVARIGGMLAPIIAMLDVIGFAIPYVAFGLLALLGGFLGLLLPETLEKKTPETLEEAEQLGKHYEGIMASICGKQDSADNEMNNEKYSTKA